jgi:hypothetical protein
MRNMWLIIPSAHHLRSCSLCIERHIQSVFFQGTISLTSIVYGKTVFLSNMKNLRCTGLHYENILATNRRADINYCYYTRIYLSHLEKTNIYCILHSNQLHHRLNSLAKVCCNYWYNEPLLSGSSPTWISASGTSKRLSKKKGLELVVSTQPKQILGYCNFYDPSPPPKPPPYSWECISSFPWGDDMYFQGG